jgi:hypothetical protein
MPAIFRAVLSDVGVRARKTSEIGAPVSLVADAGQPLPTEFEDLDAPVSLDRIAAHRILRC